MIKNTSLIFYLKFLFMKHLILFDIDGTILNFKHGIAKELFAKMLEELFEKEIPDSAIPQFHGMTDLQIIKNISENIDVKFEDIVPKVNEIWAKMYEMFQEHSLEENVTILPGVEDLIESLYNNQDTKLGLVTGNFQQNAYLKLGVKGLNKYFPTGAFGCDNSDRNMLPPIAINRVNNYFDTEVFNNYNTIIIGDTHRDIECAQKNNIKVLAVATGSFSSKELSVYNPDKVVENFSNLEHSLNEIYSLLNTN